MVWALALGFTFWADIPTLPLLAGSAIVVCSGLFLLWHEIAVEKPTHSRSVMKIAEENGRTVS